MSYLCSIYYSHSLEMYELSRTKVEIWFGIQRFLYIGYFIKEVMTDPNIDMNGMIKFIAYGYHQGRPHVVLAFFSC